jgi:hypothetical protein
MVDGRRVFVPDAIGIPARRTLGLSAGRAADAKSVHCARLWLRISIITRSHTTREVGRASGRSERQPRRLPGFHVALSTAMSWTAELPLCACRLLGTVRGCGRRCERCAQLLAAHQTRLRPSAHESATERLLACRANFFRRIRTSGAYRSSIALVAGEVTLQGLAAGSPRPGRPPCDTGLLGGGRRQAGRWLRVVLAGAT